MFNLILFLVQNVVSDVIYDDTYCNIRLRLMPQIGNQSLIDCSLKANFIIEKPFVVANFTATTVSVIHHI